MKSPVTKATESGELDDYINSMRAYLNKSGTTARDSSPEFRWKDLAANSQQYSNVKLGSQNWQASVSSSTKKNCAK